MNVSEDHLKLLQRANVRWWDAETGAPCVDPKRPYGNGDVEMDIAKILGWELFEDADGDKHLNGAQHALAERLHKETEEALRQVLGSVQEWFPLDQGEA